MTTQLFKTYDSTPLGIKTGKWNHGTKRYGMGGNSGWYISITLPWFTGRYQFQVRKDNYLS